MKVRITTISLIAMLIMMLAAVSVAQAIEEVPVGRDEIPVGWDYLCPTGSTVVLDAEGYPLLDQDCLDEYLDGEVVFNTAGDAPSDKAKFKIFIEKCVVCEQTVTELTETATVQQDAYAEAATTTRSSMPSTGFLLLPAAGLLAAGAGVLLARKRS